MKSVVRMMDDMGQMRAIEDGKYKKKNRKQQLELKAMSEEVKRLNQEILFAKPVNLKKKTDLDAIKLNRTVTVDTIMQSKNFHKFRDFGIPKDALDICEGSGLTIDDLKAVR